MMSWGTHGSCRAPMHRGRLRYRRSRGLCCEIACALQKLEIHARGLLIESELGIRCQRSEIRKKTGHSLFLRYRRSRDALVDYSTGFRRVSKVMAHTYKSWVLCHSCAIFRMMSAWSNCNAASGKVGLVGEIARIDRAYLQRLDPPIEVASLKPSSRPLSWLASIQPNRPRRNGKSSQGRGISKMRASRQPYDPPL